MAFFNPFCSQEAISYSNYCTLKNTNYTSSKSLSAPMDQATKQVASKLSAFVADLKKPRQLFGINTTRRSCSFGVYPQLGSTEATAGLCRDLASFLHEHKEGESKNTTFMAVFTTPSKLSEEHFQEKVAAQIALLQKAAEPFYCTPASEKARQQEEEQTVNFGGKVLKVVATHRNTSQGNLKFDYPMLAFSLLPDHNAAKPEPMPTEDKAQKIQSRVQKATGRFADKQAKA